MSQAIRVKLVRSPAGRIPKQLITVRGLGLRCVNSERVLKDTPAVRGMIRKVSHLVAIVEENIKM